MPAPPTAPYTTEIPESPATPPGHGVSPRHLHAASMVLGSIITASALGLLCYLLG